MPDFGPKERERIQVIFNDKWWRMEMHVRWILWDALLVDLGVERKSGLADEGVTIEDPSGYMFLFVPNEVALKILVLQEIP
jgi:hypothetical protein